MARKTRRNRKNAGENSSESMMGGQCGAHGMMGGKKSRSKKSRRMHKGASDWNKHVMRVYREMKAKDPNVKLGAAMKRAAAERKKQ